MITSNPDPRSLIPVPSARRGSALLIVLGMIAFLVISAVAFSAYMRYSRLPSSYLRRTSASRQLVKAALAEAIDQIDIALGNDPYPYALGYEYNEGSDYTGSEYDMPRAEDSVTRIKARRDKRNFWRSHCFIGTNNLVLANETVSTLTLEALAYLPPALINEARYYSRHSVGARWHNFGFDAGRYAFFAVDVSDHIDVNRVFADCARTSADKGRITLSHVFEKPTHDGDGSPTAQEWDKDLVAELAFGGESKLDDIKDGVKDAYRNAAAGALPFVSLADLNLAINRKWGPEKGGSILSPFCWCVRNGKKDFYQDTGNSSEMARQMAFVTDSYFPNTNTTATIPYDLAYRQPFTDLSGDKSERQRTIEEIIPQTTPMMTRMKDYLSGLDVISLYDYLDGNDIPTSLGLPTTERTPMICGLAPTAGFQFELTKELEGGFDPSQPPPASMPDGQAKLVDHYFKLKLNNPTVDADVLCMFPFRRDTDAEKGKTYTLDFAARIGLTIGNGPGLRVPETSAFIVRDDADFRKNTVENGVIKLYKQANQNPKGAGVTDEASAMTKVSASFDLSAVENVLNNTPMFTVTHKYVVETVPNTDPPQRRWRDDGIANEKPPTKSTAFYPLNANGTGDGGFNVAALLAGNAAVKVRPFMTVTARIRTSVKAGNADVVDLVPASVYDDANFNQVANADVVCISGDNNHRPLISVADVGGSAELTFGEGSWSGSPVAQMKPSSNGGSFICPDPRWNFAPENFYLHSDQLQAGSWFPDLCGVENQQRDCDIFLGVSNQGYLQSLAEIAMLPRTSVDFGGGDQMLGDASRALSKTGFDTWPGPGDTFQTAPHGFLMWRTYRVFRHDGLAADPIYDMGITSSGTGFRVNPFTESPDVMMAALANTPYSWWAASTNYSSNTSGKKELDGLGASEFKEDYAFCQMSQASPSAKFYWKDLKLIAEKLMDVMRRRDGRWWEGFASLDWDGKNSDLCDVKFANGTNADDLKDVDRKFLYGFWRDCFAVRQQLFLVFVRAEPTLMGAGSANATPPQLGARAVALVWRDPSPTKLDTGNSQPNPHQTRVLFYRQFD